MERNKSFSLVNAETTFGEGNNLHNIKILWIAPSAIDELANWRISGLTN